MLRLNELCVGPVSTTSVFSAASSALTSSTGFCSNSYTGSVDSSYHHKYSPGTQSSFHKSLDDQLKELDSQLLSKVNVNNCFLNIVQDNRANSICEVSI